VVVVVVGRGAIGCAVGYAMLPCPALAGDPAHYLSTTTPRAGPAQEHWQQPCPCARSSPRRSARRTWLWMYISHASLGLAAAMNSASASAKRPSSSKNMAYLQGGEGKGGEGWGGHMHGRPVTTCQAAATAAAAAVATGAVEGARHTAPARARGAARHRRALTGRAARRGTARRPVAVRVGARRTHLRWTSGSLCLAPERVISNACAKAPLSTAYSMAWSRRPILRSSVAPSSPPAHGQARGREVST
jgi:hypothetical protein